MPSYRRSPRSVAVSLEALVDELAPQTALAEVQRVWPAAVGEELARQSSPTAERAGVLTVSCADAMWAQELDLMSVQILAELNSRLRSGSVRRLRCVAVGHGR
jgi:predicted nucleic acid-binding Zn ribbon protein